MPIVAQALFDRLTERTTNAKGIRMLVLSRKPNQSIDGTITAAELAELAAAGVDLSFRVAVVEVVGSRVRLGIEAPPELHILRSELKERER